MDIEERKKVERDFHNQVRDPKDTSHAGHDSHAANKRFYKVTRRSASFVSDWLTVNCKDKVVLDYCCGDGDNAITMAKTHQAARAVGIDISDVSIENARRRAGEAGLADRTQFFVGDAEKTPFPDATFDIVLCSGVLHHLDVTAAFPELARILKPGGKVLAVEALGVNPVFQLYRKLTPALRTEWEADHILGLGEIAFAGKWFGGVKRHFFHLAVVPAAFLFSVPALFEPARLLGDAIDDVLMRIPFLNRLAWQVVFELSMPRRGA